MQTPTMDAVGSMPSERIHHCLDSPSGNMIAPQTAGIGKSIGDQGTIICKIRLFRQVVNMLSQRTCLVVRTRRILAREFTYMLKK